MSESPLLSSETSARFDHTSVPHTGQVFHGDVRPVSPTRHMAGIEYDSHCCWSKLLGMVRGKEVRVKY